MQADALEPARKLGAGLAPGRRAERRRHRIAVEDRERELAERADRLPSVGARLVAQNALDHLRHHGKPERIGASSATASTACWNIGSRNNTLA